mgnify:FL=1
MKTFKLAAVVVAMIAATTNISAQENTGASVEYDFTAVTETGDTAAIDMSYIDLADAFGGQPYDVKFKDGEPKATVITGWSIGAKAGINSYGGAQYGAFVQNYFGWGHVSVNAEIGEKMEIAKELGQQFRSLGASVDFAITLAHFGNKTVVNTTGMTPYQKKHALRNERYGRSWKLYAGPSVGYQYCKNTTNFHYEDPDPDVDVPGTVDFPSVKDGSSVKYGAVLGLEKRFIGSITKVSLEGRVESYQFKSFGKSYQPVYGSVTVKIEFGLGRRPNKGRF